MWIWQASAPRSLQSMYFKHGIWVVYIAAIGVFPPVVAVHPRWKISTGTMEWQGVLALLHWRPDPDCLIQLLFSTCPNNRTVGAKTMGIWKHIVFHPYRGKWLNELCREGAITKCRGAWTFFQDSCYAFENYSSLFFRTEFYVLLQLSPEGQFWQ